jgi:hypothetical protein
MIATVHGLAETALVRVPNENVSVTGGALCIGTGRFIMASSRQSQLVLLILTPNDSTLECHVEEERRVSLEVRFAVLQLMRPSEKGAAERGPYARNDLS